MESNQTNEELEELQRQYFEDPEIKQTLDQLGKAYKWKTPQMIILEDGSMLSFEIITPFEESIMQRLVELQREKYPSLFPNS